jgi:Holliday junction resolvase RusA-like endonuclease
VTGAWTCTIPGKPKPKGNATRVMRLGRFTKVMPSDAVVVAQNNGKAIAWQQRPAALFDGAIVVDVDFVFAIPASRRKGKRALTVGEPHTQRPDRGNCLKMIEDILEGVAYADDCTVADGRVRKVWGDVDETRVRVALWSETVVGGGA